MVAIILWRAVVSFCFKTAIIRIIEQSRTYKRKKKFKRFLALLYLGKSCVSSKIDIQNKEEGLDFLQSLPLHIVKNLIMCRNLPYVSIPLLRIKILESISLDQSGKLWFDGYYTKLFLPFNKLNEQSSAISDPFQSKFLVFIAHS